MSTAWFDLRRFLNELERLVNSESPSHDLPAMRAFAELVADIGAAHLGRPAEVLEREGRRHLRWSFGTGPARVLHLAHMDTVWPLGTLAEIPFSISDGIVRGPGCYDMKGGLLMSFHAAAELLRRHGEAGLEGLTILCTADEEIGSPSSRALIEETARGADAALVLESAGPDGELKIGRKGVSFYELQVHGRAAHAGVEPEKGVNAGIEAAHQVLRIAQLGDPGAGTSVVPSVLRAGTVTNTVPAEASLAIDSRATTVAEQRRVDADLRGLAPVNSAATLELLGGINRPPMEAENAMGLFARAQRIAHRLGHRPVRSITVGGGSDGNFTAGIGTPTLDGLGTVGGGAHAANEHVEIGWLEERTALLAELTAELLGHAPAARP